MLTGRTSGAEEGLWKQTETLVPLGRWILRMRSSHAVLEGSTYEAGREEWPLVARRNDSGQERCLKVVVERANIERSLVVSPQAPSQEAWANNVSWLPGLQLHAVLGGSNRCLLFPALEAGIDNCCQY